MITLPPGAPSLTDYAVMALDAYDYRVDPGEPDARSVVDPDFAGRRAEWVHLPASGDYGERNATRAFGNGLEYNTYLNEAEGQLVIAFRGTEFSQFLSAATDLRLGLIFDQAYDEDILSLFGYWQDGGAAIEARVDEDGGVDDYLIETFGLSRALAEAAEVLLATIGGSQDGIAALAGSGEETIRSMARQAIASVLEVAAANPGTTITVTGHSLGGALAAYAAAALGVPAVSFDPAPYGETGLLGDLRSFADDLIASTYPDLDTAALGWERTGDAAQTAADRVDRVLLEGSFVPDIYLTADPGALPPGAGEAEAIALAADGVSALELHSMDLLTVVLQSRTIIPEPFGVEGLSRELPSLLAAMHDGPVVSPGDGDPNTFFRLLSTEPDFLLGFVRTMQTIDRAKDNLRLNTDVDGPLERAFEAAVLELVMPRFGESVARGRPPELLPANDATYLLDRSGEPFFAGDDIFILQLADRNGAGIKAPGLGADFVPMTTLVRAGSGVRGTLEELDGDTLFNFSSTSQIQVSAAGPVTAERSGDRLTLRDGDGARAELTLMELADTGPFRLETTEIAPGETRTTITIEPAGGALTLAEVQDVALTYEAGLGRQADPNGLNFWVDQRERGLSREGLALEFLGSTEFAETVGDPATLEDRMLVEGLYANVLGRPGDGGGIAFWEGRLADGLGRDALLVAFAESPENRAGAEDIGSIDEISPGIWDFA